jgi:hypothetical protein
MIVSLQNGIPFVLNGATIPGGIAYYWESNLSVIVNGSRFGVFTAQGSLDAVTVSDSINGGGIAFRSDGITIGNAVSPPMIKMSQSQFANFFPPDIFLSMAIYTIFDPAGGTAQILTQPPGTGGTGGTGEVGLTIPANNLIILPVLWYFNCMTSGGTTTFDRINEPLNSVINWFCVANPGTTGCSGIMVANNAWTNIPDCSNGVHYMYCPVDQNCGNNNCNGPCSVSYDDCTFSSGTFVCVFDANKFFSTTQWWQSPYFIGAVIAIILVIAVIILIIYFLNR